VVSIFPCANGTPLRSEIHVIVVGHGPSVLTGRGSLIDSFDVVVRLKRGVTTPQEHWGSRTDFICARSPRFDHGRFPFWLTEISFGSAVKPTTGLCAVLEAKRRLDPHTITVIGFDRLMHPEVPDPPHTWLAHDKWAEHRLLVSLGVKELE
jgi:hypothetical protein